MNPNLWKTVALIVFSVIILSSILILIPPIPQELSYHAFADHRSFWGLSNFCDVISNVPFLFTSYLGLVHLHHQNLMEITRIEKGLYTSFFICIGLTGLGSSYYHIDPNNVTLVWDRLPIALAFMSFLSAVIAEKIHVRAGLFLFIPLLILGTSSVLYWEYTEIQGMGDLRLYAFVLFYPLVLIPLIMSFYPPLYTNTRYLIYALLWIGVSRSCEHWDHVIFNGTYEIVSGHTLKHFASALAVYMILIYLQTRKKLRAG